MLKYPRLGKLKKRMLALDFPWFWNHGKIALRLRRWEKKPEIITSTYVPGLGEKQISQTTRRLAVFSHNLSLEGAPISLMELVCEFKKKIVHP